MEIKEDGCISLTFYYIALLCYFIVSECVMVIYLCF